MSGDKIAVMVTRRHWVGALLATSAVAACGGGDSSRQVTANAHPVAAAEPPPQATGPEPWEAIDPAFDGCAGG